MSPCEIFIFLIFMHLTKGSFPCALVKSWNMMQSVSLAEEMFSKYPAADELARFRRERRWGRAASILHSCQLRVKSLSEPFSKAKGTHQIFHQPTGWWEIRKFKSWIRWSGTGHNCLTTYMGTNVVINFTVINFALDFLLIKNHSETLNSIISLVLCHWLNFSH